MKPMKNQESSTEKEQICPSPHSLFIQKLTWLNFYEENEEFDEKMRL